MTGISRTSAPAGVPRERSTPALHSAALMLTWLLATFATGLMVVGGVRSTQQYQELRHMLLAAYVAALLWYLGRTGTPVSALGEIGPQVPPRRKLAVWVPVLGLALMFALTVLDDAGAAILMLLMILATGPILLVWRREIRLRWVIQGLAAALIAFLAGRQMAENRFVSESMSYLFPALSFPMYLAGALLFERTRLGGTQLQTGNYLRALKSLLWGGVLFVPMGLLNAADGSPGSGITWVTEWWMPFWLPWWSAIAEETWFRLLLVGMCFFLLRPAFRTRPALAVIAAVLFSGITFGLGHGRTLEGLLVTGVLYGVPLATVFARRDWEHAVGAHYVINMIPWVMVFLKA